MYIVFRSETIVNSPDSDVQIQFRSVINPKLKSRKFLATLDYGYNMVIATKFSVVIKSF